MKKKSKKSCLLRKHQIKKNEEKYQQEKKIDGYMSLIPKVENKILEYQRIEEENKAQLAITLKDRKNKKLVEKLLVKKNSDETCDVTNEVEIMVMDWIPPFTLSKRPSVDYSSSLINDVVEDCGEHALENKKNNNKNNHSNNHTNNINNISQEQCFVGCYCTIS
jgi:hypothetical protein